MITILLQGGLGNRIALLLLVIALVVIGKGTQVLVQFIRERKRKHRLSSGTHYDGMMDEFI